MKVIVHDGVEPIRQKDVPVGKWYITKYAFEELMGQAEGLTEKQLNSRLMMYIRQQSEESLWAFTWHMTKVRAYTQEEVFLVDTEFTP